MKVFVKFSLVLSFSIIAICESGYACQKMNIGGTDYWVQQDSWISGVGYGSYQGCFEGTGAEKLPSKKVSYDNSDDNPGSNDSTPKVQPASYKQDGDSGPLVSDI